MIQDEKEMSDEYVEELLTGYVSILASPLNKFLKCTVIRSPQHYEAVYGLGLVSGIRCYKSGLISGLDKDGVRRRYRKKIAPNVNKLLPDVKVLSMNIIEQSLELGKNLVVERESE